MFSGLNKNFKKILPKQLFYRGLLIVALPIVILQITITIVFFDSLWIKTNKGMTRSLVSEIKTFIDVAGVFKSTRLEIYIPECGSPTISLTLSSFA